MDTYIKSWLQLAFPTYVFILVVIVIVYKDPVATLATLILLSYAKFHQICLKLLSVGILIYPDGSGKAIWLPDATVSYLNGNHTSLFVVAVLILLVSVTLLLSFSGSGGFTFLGGRSFEYV